MTLKEKIDSGCLVSSEAIITIGMFDQETKKQEMTEEEYLRIIYESIFDLGIFGATIFTQGIYGVFRHNDGKIVQEPSIRIEICGEDRKKVMELVINLRKHLNQESIMFKYKRQIIEFVNDQYSVND